MKKLEKSKVKKHFLFSSAITLGTFLISKWSIFFFIFLVITFILFYFWQKDEGRIHKEFLSWSERERKRIEQLINSNK